MVHPGFPGSRHATPPTKDFSAAPGTTSPNSNVTKELKPPGLAKRSARLVVISGRDLHREYSIALEDFQGNSVRNVLGSGPDCQVIISGDPSVSTRHCEIRMQDGHLCIFNLASTNPTIICRGINNKFDVAGQEFLRNQDRIWVGSTELELHISEFQQSDLGR